MQVVIAENGHVVDISDEDMIWHLDEGMRIEHIDAAPVLEHPIEDYIFVDGDFTYVEPDPEPLQPYQVIKAIFTASPALTVGIVDMLAARMAPYLPDYDSAQTYSIGMLVVMDGVVKRRTIGGWREVA